MSPHQTTQYFQSDSFAYTLGCEVSKYLFMPANHGRLVAPTMVGVRNCFDF